MRAFVRQFATNDEDTFDIAISFANSSQDALPADESALLSFGLTPADLQAMSSAAKSGGGKPGTIPSLVSSSPSARASIRRRSFARTSTASAARPPSPFAATRLLRHVTRKPATGKQLDGTIPPLVSSSTIRSTRAVSSLLAHLHEALSSVIWGHFPLLSGGTFRQIIIIILSSIIIVRHVPPLPTIVIIKHFISRHFKTLYLEALSSLLPWGTFLFINLATLSVFISRYFPLCGTGGTFLLALILENVDTSMATEPAEPAADFKCHQARTKNVEASSSILVTPYILAGRRRVPAPSFLPALEA